MRVRLDPRDTRPCQGSAQTETSRQCTSTRGGRRSGGGSTSLEVQVWPHILSVSDMPTVGIVGVGGKEVVIHWSVGFLEQVT